MERFIKGNIMIIKNKEMDIKYIKMAICMLGSIIRIKNMVEAHFFGLVSVKIQQLNMPIKKFNNIKVYGGVDFQMDKVNIKNAMVHFN